MEQINSGNAKAMKVEYCGVWNYRPKVVEAIEKMKEAGIEFNMFLIPDEGRTGRMEFTIYNSAEPEGEGVVAFSKKTLGKYPSGDYEFFIEAIKSHAWVNIHAFLNIKNGMPSLAMIKFEHDRTSLNPIEA